MLIRLLTFNKKKKYHFALSLVIAAGIGLIFPIFSIFMGQNYVNLLNYNSLTSNQSDIYLSSLKFLFVAITVLILYFLQSLCG
jgi:hypothetical protein